MTEKQLLRYLKKHFTYHSDGSLTRKDRKNSNGSYDKDGYLIIKIKQKQYKAHRLVYLLFNGKLPNGEIDHINRDKTDNRIENFRVTDRRGNILNRDKKPNPDTGVVGIHLDNSTKGLKKRYTFKHNGETYRFYTLEEATKRKGELNGSLQKTS